MNRVFVIAEAGINHNGSIELAKKMIDAACEACADAVKFQTFNTEGLVTRNAKKAEYQVGNTRERGSQYEMLKRLELKRDEFKQLANYAREKNIIFLSSPFDKDCVDLLDEIGVRTFKIPSGEITNYPLIQYIARKGKPIILSTGMSNLKEITKALNLIRKEGVKDITLLHCVSDYPAKTEDINLKVIETLRGVFGLPVGLSDHTQGIVIPIAAVALGACVIEKHFTLDRKLPGPDHKASLEPPELKEMIKAIREIEKALGNGVKRPTKNEEKIKKLARRSIVARVDIFKGSRITSDMLSIKRPGTGIGPRFLNSVIGKKTKHKIKKDTLLKLNDLI